MIYRYRVSFPLDKNMTLHVMVMATRNFSEAFKFPVREQLRGPMLDSIHKRHIDIFR